MSAHHLQTEIDIAAPPDRVWAVLTDFAAYPDWNPFIRSIRGVPEQGARLVVRIQPNGARSMTFRPTILTLARHRALCWLGHLLVPGVFDGEHCFTILPIAQGQVLFRQSEEFRGILVPILKAGLDRDTKRGFEDMNFALKAQAEALARQG